MTHQQSTAAETKLERPSLWGKEANEPSDSVTMERAITPPSSSFSQDELVIDHLILHSLDSERGELKLVDDDAELDDATHAYFAQHIHHADVNAEWYAEFEEPTHQIMTTCASLLRLQSDGFAHLTHDLATRLYEIMCAPGRFRERIAPGDMVVVLYHTVNDPVHRLAILKVELDSERRIRDFVGEDGHRKVIFRPASGLLPQVERLQKCAIIWFEADDEMPSLRLLDKDAGPVSEGVAAFFYKDFLGASLRMSSKRRTRLFWAETNKWLNTRSSTYTPGDLLHFFQVRRTALRGEWLDIQRFVVEALPIHPDDAQHLLTILTKKLNLPNDDGTLIFEVNSKVAKPYLENITLLLDGKMKLTVNAERFHDLVRVSESRTGEGKIIITLETQTFQETSG